MNNFIKRNWTYVSGFFASCALYSVMIKLLAPLEPCYHHVPSWWEAIGLGIFIAVLTLISEEYGIRKKGLIRDAKQLDRMAINLMATPLLFTVMVIVIIMISHLFQITFL